MALDYMFRQGLIHRDVKPANILTVTRTASQVVDVKITDFGSVFAEPADADRTQVFRVGSLAYMSPEQLDGRHGRQHAPTSIRSPRCCTT